MEITRIAIVGTGLMGRLFARLVAELPNAVLVGVADSAVGVADSVGDEYGVPAFLSAHALLAQVSCDAVIVATDEDEHLEPAREAARAGKAILLEKPMATSAADAREILREVHEAATPLMVAHCVRFDPRYAGARAAIRSGELGNLAHVTARRNAPLTSAQRIAGRCSATMYLGVHDIDFMLWATGAQVTQVHAVGHQQVLKDLGVQDTILSLLKFDDGTIGSLETCWVGPRVSWQFEAVGAKGSVHIVSPELGSARYGSSTIQPSNPLYSFEPLPSGETHNVYRAELSHFLRSVVNKAPFVVQPVEAFAAVAVAEAIDRSVRTGQPESPERP
jgi:predicted dehydrogenase